MDRSRIPRCCGKAQLLPGVNTTTRLVLIAGLLKDSKGAALLEFAIVLPLLVVFVVGIYDFSSDFNQKQKIEQAAQEGAIIAGAQPTSDINSANSSASGPDSLQPVVTAIYNSLVASGTLPAGTCTPPGTVTHAGKSLTWTFTISGCSGSDNLVITVDRGKASASAPPAAVGTKVTVEYPYHWRFNGVIQLLFPGATYAAITQVTESATVHNQM
jgi:Flp pilus assembly protein TadG